MAIYYAYEKATGKPAGSGVTEINTETHGSTTMPPPVSGIAEPRFDEASGTWSAATIKADIWRRATDAEADVMDQLLSSQPTKMRRIWEDSRFLSHADPYFQTVRGALTQAFGEARAAQLLAPSE